LFPDDRLPFIISGIGPGSCAGPRFPRHSYVWLTNETTKGDMAVSTEKLSSAMSTPVVAQIVKRTACRWMVLAMLCLMGVIDHLKS
jgi:hypothetical protein